MATLARADNKRAENKNKNKNKNKKERA
jgi:hypothetical protein